MSGQQSDTTANEGAEALRVYAENERMCGRFGIAKDLDNAADEIDRLVGVLRLIAECKLCGYRLSITTAGRPDDPRSVSVPCNMKGAETHG